MSHNRKKLPLRLPLKAELEKRTCNGAGAETAVQTARVHKLRLRIARQRVMHVVFKHSKTLCGLERQHMFKWMPWHVWLTKRCAMCCIWEWKMAVWRNDSTQRAAFREAQSANINKRLLSQSLSRFLEEPKKSQMCNAQVLSLQSWWHFLEV